MQKVAVTVLGSDRPGIVCAVASVFAKMGCNIEDVSQTVLQDEFAGIFIVALPQEVSREELDLELRQHLEPEEIYHFMKLLKPETAKSDAVECESFVVITLGPDKVGLIAGMTSIMKECNVNITNLQFINRTVSFPDQSVSIFEVDVPVSMRLKDFVERLQKKAAELGLEVNVQHKKIFEDICHL